MDWSVAYATELPFMFVLAVNGNIKTELPSFYHCYLNKTFIWYEDETMYLESNADVRFGKIMNNDDEQRIYLDQDTPEK